MSKRLVCIIAFAILASCKTTGAAAPERIQAADAAIRDADGSGAANVPDATSYLQMAREELTEGKQLSNSGYAHRAELVLERATDDARLSSAIARKDKLARENVEIGKQLGAPQ